MFRLLGLDLDGTLLNDQKKICRPNIENLQKAKEQGVKIVLCSGRSADGMQRELNQLALKEEGQYGIALNGGVIFETTGKVLKKNLMNEEAAKALISLGRSMLNEINIQLYTGDRVCVERWNETTDFYQEATGSHPQIVENLMDYAEKTVKIVFFSRGVIDESLNKIRMLKEKVEGQLPKETQSVISAPYLLEFFDQKVDKGRAVKELADYLRIGSSEVICVGDQENDLPMLRYAGVGAVMQNGAPEVKAAADYITEKNNNEGGVAEVVERFILAKEEADI